MNTIPNKLPLVSIICTCYNQAAFVEQTLNSILSQDYPHLEVFVSDNGSTDDSARRIQDFCQKNIHDFQISYHLENVGICKAFNQSFAKATGKYIIDLSADDILLLHCVSQQVQFFEKQPDEVGVIYSNIEWINEQGKSKGKAFGNLPPPSGNVWLKLLAKSFIPAPAMMMRRSLLLQMGGYNEQLAYEDLDFWLRSSRVCHYAYLPKVLMQVRKVPNSATSGFNDAEKGLLESAYRVCLLTQFKLDSRKEHKALDKRILNYCLRAYISQQFETALRFAHLLSSPIWKKIITYLIKRKTGLRVIIRLYHLFKYVN